MILQTDLREYALTLAVLVLPIKPTGYDVTPNPKGAKPSREALDERRGDCDQVGRQ